MATEKHDYSEYFVDLAGRPWRFVGLNTPKGYKHFVYYWHPHADCWCLLRDVGELEGFDLDDTAWGLPPVGMTRLWDELSERHGGPGDNILKWRLGHEKP